MKVLGLVVEYNPFHNGHLYHIKEAKKITGAEYVVCVMSGNFIQRGEPAIVNKWARTKMALLGGADLVIELPVPYALASAEYFAYGAVKILNDIGITDYLCFGSETGKIKPLDDIAGILCDEPLLYKSLLKNELKKGLSYPAAKNFALLKYFHAEKELYKNIDKFYKGIDNLLDKSNNILGIEYLKALKRLNSKIVPFTIKRINNDYNTEKITGSISSATAIRKHLLNTQDFSLQNISETLPKSSFKILDEEFSNGRGPVFASCFYPVISALIRKMPANYIKETAYVQEGLENRIKRAADNTGTYNELVGKICTKRYTITRVQRILMSIMIGITSNDIKNFIQFGPQYARILGFNESGKYLMSLIKKKSSIPLIQKTANFKNYCNPLLKRMLELESISTDLYVLGYKNPEYKKAGQEFTQKIIKIE